MSRKRKALSFKEKLEILNRVDSEPKKKRSDLAKELGLPPSTLCTIVGQRDTILKNVRHFSGNVKQAKTAQHVKLEDIPLTWFKEVTAAGVNIDGKVLREKADDVALSLGIENFQASGGCVHRFKQRCPPSFLLQGKKVDNSVLGVECSSHNFITVDDDLATCGTRTIEDIVGEMKEPEQHSDSDGEDCGGSEEAPSTSETLHALDVLRRAVSLGTVCEETSAKFYALQKGLLGNMEVIKRQKNITDFFTRKSFSNMEATDLTVAPMSQSAAESDTSREGSGRPKQSDFCITGLRRGWSFPSSRAEKLPKTKRSD
ncbi:hypothetical protein HPB47_013420 [Ixodes persulcatus]|uniref:Uncharacterized protein n=1 Tax=Ixodes persulcatus TaxID=34615 RepID=A0AC60R1P5_IXOPE|nr:hypothetical protein HPB47_013420 [Ixodes persulcatus]